MGTVFCVKLKKEAPALERQPIPGPLGKRIVDHVSAEAWGMWLSYQTMLINEYRLSLIDQRARDYLLQQMEKYFFCQDIMETPEGYRPVDQQES